MSNHSVDRMQQSEASSLSLSDRQIDLTRQVIIDAALELLELGQISDLTNRLIAARANVSERTVYRHCGTRDQLLDAMASAIGQRLNLPPVPDSVAGLVLYPFDLYPRYEAHAALTRAALHPDVFHRIRGTLARRRWEQIHAVMAAHAPGMDAHAMELAAANVRFFLAATAWHYYREYFGLGLDDAMQAVSGALGHIIDGLTP